MDIQLTKAAAVGWEYRTFFEDNTVNPGWGPWERLTPRNPNTDTVEDRVAEIQAYIDRGYLYELRAIYTGTVVGSPGARCIQSFADEIKSLCDDYSSTNGSVYVKDVQAAIQALADKYLPETVPSTPAAQWRAEGMPDPHGSGYDCERAALCLGHLTDDELANEAFLNYDRRPSVRGMLDGSATAPIVYMTAVKERIRWLSRKLEEALTLTRKVGQ